MNQDEKKIIIPFFYGIIFVASILPVFADYILQLPGNELWIQTVTELADGTSHPLGTVTLQTEIWYKISAAVYLLTGNLKAAYNLWIVLLQAGTMAASYWFFHCLFSQKNSSLENGSLKNGSLENGSSGKISVFFSVMLYMTMPYRLAACYDFCDFGQSIFWMLLPLYCFGFLQTAKAGKLGKQTITGIVLEGISLAAIGYADNKMLFITAGFTVLAAFGFRKLLPLIGSLLGFCLWLPAGIPFLKAIFTNSTEASLIALCQINSGSYTPGQLITSYAYTAGKPGLGLGLILGLFLLLWLSCLREKEPLSSFSRISLWLGGFSILLSLHIFPWDMAQRLGNWSLKLISCLQTPSVFLGIACFFFCIPVAETVHQACRHSNKTISTAVPLVITTAAIGIAFYLCNTLTFSTPPILQ